MYIKMFGEYGIYLKNEKILLNSKKAEYILYYLILNNKRKVFVNEILDIFFEGYEESYSRKNLNTLLYMIRKGLNITKEELKIEKNQIFLDTKKLKCDYLQFQKLAEKKPSEKVLNEITKIYTGELLRDLDFDWIIPFRELCEMQVLLITQQLNIKDENIFEIQNLPTKNEIQMELAIKLIAMDKKRRNPMFYPLIIKTTENIKDKIRKSDFYVKLSQNTYLVLFETGDSNIETLKHILKLRFKNNLKILEEL
ncbi:histidine kinase [Thermosipho melanesiensis]|uniref:Response regulator receiver and SARP domain protein n=2 Tax=Thermosipho melanesiensis TaxID=46541 RepID=A6LNZ6_THEM4|nr:hypothetical protein [Thermosipho melanesiensis]ABR31647.1 response regulator receiver and SARP domain protein [Thermosipho melanesiensis BI429]APT74676.1 histidine kinase [Thermosipho melanesiensis]OOC35173.1 histidine kinase [Thermosipho melanesiensis]OOC35383.1 histidine kinase [Thermosipho melanesiensis]OOC36634.1 histidine kinase [Thermosipho melanesiensis]